MIGSVLIPGAAAPKLITAETVKAMKPGAVIVDIAIDQGGCAATSRPTTHSHPTYIVDDVVHYCVTNMPGAVARTSTFALNNVTLPFVLALADKGVATRAGRGSPLAQRAQRLRRQGHTPGRRAGAKAAIHAAGSGVAAVESAVERRRHATKSPAHRPGLSWGTPLQSEGRHHAFQPEKMSERFELSFLVLVEAHDQREPGGLEPFDIHLAHVDRGCAGA